ncbi:isopentenyl-diphosphate Delta-isomerase [Mucilaginibacter corticis]|uniref:Isopentenyl-diphosphate delta-isomerase n=1 Tax=Mucilaginibacter corticis TaxID=2597670 RepID=A0A556MBG2_9SPHI|nr:isopentenyl-diphosphate Delta-isomerase [Mucilaginibacter corticis]TSJ37243.1 isopentenyl-diphosphate Delta-isomerase [Mucilaginibacter corticis]
MAFKEVILVDELDNEIGVMEKQEAHLSPNLHRAFSIFIFNSKGEMLLQQRADEKYHSSGLWTNTCCSHPAPGEDIVESAKKRLNEEMGFTTNISEVFSFIYQAGLDNGLTEYEYDHVFIGEYDSVVNPDAAEVKAYSYKSLDEIEQEITQKPDLYTEWFKIAFPKLREIINR